MNTEEFQALILRTAAKVAVLSEEVSELNSKEKRITVEVNDLNRRVDLWLDNFDQDGYKSTDQRLTTAALAGEILIVEKLGYGLRASGSRFVLAVAALLEGRHKVALEHLQRFLTATGATNRSFRDANYLAGMICYNTERLRDAIGFFREAFRLSPENDRDWQSRIYIAELLFLLRESIEAVERAFADAREGVLQLPGESFRRQFLEATLRLKMGNAFLGAMELAPVKPNPMAKDRSSLAVQHYKAARKACPKGAETKGSLLPVVIDYSLAQAIMADGKLDMDIPKTPTDLFADVFHRLRKIVLTKREEIILAQSYFMLATCAYYAKRLSKEVGEIYLEHARHQTLGVPQGVSIYSCVTKELLSKEKFVQQLDFFESLIQTRKQKGFL